MASRHIFAVGGAHIDRRGQVSATYVPSASNPGTVSEEVGGGVFNALRNTVRRGITASLLSVRGGDWAGANVARAIAASGIADLSAVFLDRATPSYTALLDQDGELIAGLADMALYEMAFPKQIRRAKVREEIARANAVLCDANLPEAALKSLLALTDGKSVFAIAISPAKVIRLSRFLDRVSCLFMNAAEAAALCGEDRNADAPSIVASLRRAGLDRGIITAGGGAVTGFDGSDVFSLLPPAPRRIADVTGAGDALAGVAIANLMAGKPLRDALRFGMAAAMLTVESHAAVADIEDDDLAAALALVPYAQQMA